MTTAGLLLARFWRERFAVVVLVGVLLVPAIYGAVLVWAYWDPYARSERIPAALVNLDEPVTVGTEKVAAGDELVDQVLDDGDLVWTTTDAAAAQAGLQDKTYYVVLTIPRGFSAQMASFATSEPVRAELRVTTDDAANYLVGVLAKDAVTSVQGAASSQVQAGYLDVVYDAAGSAKDDAGSLSAGADDLADGTQDASDAAGDLADGASAVAAGVQQVADALAEVDDGVQGLPDAVAGLEDTAQKIADGAGTVDDSAAKTVADLTAIQDQLADAGQDDLAQAVGQVADTVRQTAVPAADQAASDADDLVGAAGDLADAAAKAVSDADAADAAAGDLADGAGQVADGAADLHTALSDQLAPGAAQLAASLDQLASLDPPVTDADRAAFTRALSQPVSVERTAENPIGHFGDGFASYFAGLGLFVGAVFVFLVLAPLDRRTQLYRGSPWRAACAPFLAGAAIVVAQALLLFAALLAVGLRADAGAGLLGILVASGLSFVALLQVLKAAFGLVGEFLGVVVLVLQVAAGEGAYPIQTFGSFFQALHPWLPMSYTNDAVRRTVAGGPLGPWLWTDLAVLLGVGAACLALSAWVARRRQRITLAELRPVVELA
ncbi:YhgE/Pip family protein [Cellulomonas sp. PhB143]|uniref:YhgE/Pip family protein n=1 Tax=Cellulomonas sp. PhB143 TaxID=2485186 RepID=UPI000F499EAE|nr:YhgE/Pip family protein [Cellulomonas sp. PhB143]ROS75393.1 putative membrane protein [Cellulomonas sp. PhB143]